MSVGLLTFLLTVDFSSSAEERTLVEEIVERTQITEEPPEGITDAEGCCSARLSVSVNSVSINSCF